MKKSVSSVNVVHHSVARSSSRSTLLILQTDLCLSPVGLGTDFQEITTNIVLLGDHKQLGPVISSKIADRLGLGEIYGDKNSFENNLHWHFSFRFFLFSLATGVSLMERIMSKRRYQKSLHDKSYDKNYVTQLLDNFRSHPAILQFSNVLFYDSELRAKLAEPELSFGTKYMYLTNKKFPVVFHCCKEKSQRVLGGTSSYNEGEIKLVRFYVDSLLKLGIGGRDVKPEDIGVVSPYKAQLYMLRDELQHAGGVEIGTAEYYQGREKKIIIISTVKSRDNVGFLKNEKRLNVCITRAKCLLILVGNADTLQVIKHSTVSFFTIYLASLTFHSKTHSGTVSCTSAKRTMHVAVRSSSWQISPKKNKKFSTNWTAFLISELSTGSLSIFSELLTRMKHWKPLKSEWRTSICCDNESEVISA